ncbi:hypothetical protein E6O75_ATG06414 [Venturia nashicola]|uniref:Uncharacterized protein n=1 Tax=Venturia nashicola TaxID=86259 RepID=A0A4Z1PBI5_9PEZI|nr:hypothetical protein E6O75_ATG06414 [Venturia nashicola]
MASVAVRGHGDSSFSLAWLKNKLRSQLRKKSQLHSEHALLSERIGDLIGGMKRLGLIQVKLEKDRGTCPQALVRPFVRNAKEVLDSVPLAVSSLIVSNVSPTMPVKITIWAADSAVLLSVLLAPGS